MGCCLTCGMTCAPPPTMSECGAPVKPAPHPAHDRRWERTRRRYTILVAERRAAPPRPLNGIPLFHGQEHGSPTRRRADNHHRKQGGLSKAHRFARARLLSSRRRRDGSCTGSILLSRKSHRDGAAHLQTFSRYPIAQAVSSPVSLVDDGMKAACSSIGTRMQSSIPLRSVAIAELGFHLRVT